MTEFSGIVVKGKQIGRTLGFPTANVMPDDSVFPAYGVYYGTVSWNGSVHTAMINVGRHPTFPEGAPTIEAHLPGFSGDIYGIRVSVRLIRLIRHEMRFSDASKLTDQLKLDLETVLAEALK